MSDATILLASDNDKLTNQIREIVSAVPNLGLIAVREVDAIYNQVDWSGIGLVLIHQTTQGSTLQIARLLGMITATRRPVTVVVIGESFNDEQRSKFRQIGVVDCVTLPEDRVRLAHLCQILTLPHRVGSVVTDDAPMLFPAATPKLGPVHPANAILDGSTPQIQAIVDLVRRVAPQNATVLLGGETGTGKTHLARQIHALSERRDEPFVEINCGSSLQAVIEGELFGHVRGAFEGATADRPGKLAEVGRGTLFLDGIESLPLAVQAKLLKVVEDRTFEPIGGFRPQPLKARLIAASNRPLDEEIAERRFRSDLFYRLNVVGLQLPPLRERREVIPVLANRFLSEYGAAYGRSFEPLSDETVEALQKHDWPGNIRELRNVLDCCAATCPDRSIRRDDLPPSVLNGGSLAAARSDSAFALAASASPASLAVTKGQAELARINEALEKHNGNRLRAAVELKISRMTLYKKLYKYGLMDPPRTANLVPHR